MPEQVAVVDARAPAQVAHRLAKLLLDERVDGDSRAAAHPADGEPQVVDGLDARMPDLLEVEVGELRLERDHEPRRRLARGVGDDVQLDRRLRARAHSRPAYRAALPPMAAADRSRWQPLMRNGDAIVAKP
jgi:hypothetical protein